MAATSVGEHRLYAELQHGWCSGEKYLVKIFCSQGTFCSCLRQSSQQRLEGTPGIKYFHFASTCSSKTSCLLSSLLSEVCLSKST